MFVENGKRLLQTWLMVGNGGYDDSASVMVRWKMIIMIITNGHNDVKMMDNNG